MSAPQKSELIEAAIAAWNEEHGLSPMAQECIDVLVDMGIVHRLDTGLYARDYQFTPEGRIWIERIEQVKLPSDIVTDMRQRVSIWATIRSRLSNWWHCANCGGRCGRHRRLCVPF